ncbi:hypothetical protein TNCV_3200151 [Trichonephila clavipes]|nr:hypothetical protein TNCV_3200151 [Trichonephila clavipes]
MSDSKSMKRARKFKDRRKRAHDEEERSGPVITDDLMQAIETKIRENRRFTISNLSLEFPDISRSVVYKTVLKTSTLRYPTTFGTMILKKHING